MKKYQFVLTVAGRNLPPREVRSRGQISDLHMKKRAEVAYEKYLTRGDGRDLPGVPQASVTFMCENPFIWREFNRSNGWPIDPTQWEEV